MRTDKEIVIYQGFLIEEIQEAEAQLRNCELIDLPFSFTLPLLKLNIKELEEKRDSYLLQE